VLFTFQVRWNPRRFRGPDTLCAWGACFSTTKLNVFFQACQISLGFLNWWIKWVPVLLTNIIAKFSRIEVFKHSIAYCSMSSCRHSNGKFSKGINKTVITYTNVRDTRADHSIRSVCKNVIYQCWRFEFVIRVCSVISCWSLYVSVISMSNLELWSKTVELKSQFRSPTQYFQHQVYLVAFLGD
jgi:hypothetical protein